MYTRDDSGPNESGMFPATTILRNNIYNFIYFVDCWELGGCQQSSCSLVTAMCRKTLFTSLGQIVHQQHHKIGNRETT